MKSTQDEQKSFTENLRAQLADMIAKQSVKQLDSKNIGNFEANPLEGKV